jgi:transposase
LRRIEAGHDGKEEWMQPLTPRTPEVVDVKRLGHLPLVGAMLRELAVKDLLDALMPPHQRNEVTVGECVEALVLTILTGEHALSRVAETLAGYDLEVIFQRPVDAAHFHDNRLGRALDTLWATGLDRLYGVVISHAIHQYALELVRLHTDATSLKVYGAYERDDEEGPRVTLGYSRDHRPDLKQLLFGLTVTAEGIPLWGHVTDGNRSDSTEHRFHLTQLRQYLPDLGEPLLVADSKFFAGETLALAAGHRFRFVTLVPQTVGLRQEVVDVPELRELPLLWERPGRRQGETEHYRGASLVRPYRWKTAAGEVQELPVRLLVVESTQLAKAKAPRLAAAQPTEQDTLAALYQQWQRRWFACEADAHQAATLCLRELAVRYHVLTYTVASEWVPDRHATRGRPPKHAPRPQRQVWRVTWRVREASQVLTAQARRASRFVLATNVLDVQQLSDAELLRAYKGQPAAELSFKWAKNPAALAPIFLETPTRIAALGCVYLIALLVYTLVERQVRKALVERGETLPDRPAPSQRPTARTVFQLMRTIAVVTLLWAGQRRRQVTTLNAHQLHVLGLLGYGEAIYTMPHRNSG